MFTQKPLCFLLSFLLILSQVSINAAKPAANAADKPTGKLEKMVVDNGVVTLNLDGARVGAGKAKVEPLRFTLVPDSFFTFIAFNNELRTAQPGTMALNAQNAAAFPAALKGVTLAIEQRQSEEAFGLVVRDAKSGFVFFNVEAQEYSYDANKHVIGINGGRLLLSSDFANKLGRASDAGSVAGTLSATTTVIPIEIDKITNGLVESVDMPAHSPSAPNAGSVPGPDVIVGDVSDILQRTASVNGFVGIGIGTTSCNAGTVDLDWFALPSNDHPVIPQNLYRMSGGTSNTDRFEQIGQSWLKHAFTALTENICGYGCNGVGSTHLGSGCSDPYVASLNDGGSTNNLGSRAWVNPFTGAFPGSSPDPRNHTGHTHNGLSHRVMIAISDINNTLNPGAKYFAEGQYVTPHEYAWCTSHPGQCNMNNNVSYRQFNITGTTTFTYSAAAATVRTKPAISAWTGASSSDIVPDAANDGIGQVAYKVTNPSAGVWHYEYAVYNQNMDRGVQSFSVPLGCGVTVSNLGFHMPPQHPAWANDGTPGSAGYSSTPWASNQTLTSLSWNCETFAQNQNANAIRWGTLYNFRFDSNKPPQTANATIGFFKTGSPITVRIQAPTPDPCSPLQETSAVSRKTQGVDTFDVDLATTECRSGGPTGDYTVVFTFSNNVTGGSVNITQGTGSVSGSPTFSTNTMTVNLTGLTEIDSLGMVLHNVQDSFGQTLPDTAATLNVVVGDTNGDGMVNAADIGEVKAQTGKGVDVTTMREDLNSDGAINSADVSIAKSKSGTGM